MTCAQRLFRRAWTTDDEEMMEIYLESQLWGGVGGTASDTGSAMDNNNSGGLKCRVFKKWTVPVLTSVCKENHNVFKSLFCK